MRTKVVWVILMALVSVTALAGCSGGGGGGEVGVAPPPSREEIIREHLEGRDLDPIEGIWLWDSGEYEAAVFKGTDSRHPGYEYVAVLTSTRISGWRIGEVKVALKKTTSEDLYAVAYYYSDKTMRGTVATLANGTILEMNLPQVGRTALVKVYPIKGKGEAKPAKMGAGFFIAKDVVAAVAINAPPAIAAANASSVPISGTASTDISSVTVTLTDHLSGSTSSSGVPVTGGTWTVNMNASALAEGSITVSVSGTDVHGNPASGTASRSYALYPYVTSG
jgi:hypothetical protein